MLVVTDFARAELASRLAGSSSQSARRLVPRGSGLVLRRSKMRFGDMVVKHKGQVVLFFTEEVAKRVGDRVLDARATADGTKLGLRGTAT